jgi:transcriptional regulator with XRE-family HTH domain
MRRGARGSGVTVDPARVREAREQAGLSLAQLAGDDVSRTFLHYVERGKARPSPAVLALIARRTGRPISYFVATPSAQPLLVVDIAPTLTSIASRLRRMMADKRLSKTDYAALRLLEVSIRQGSQLVRAIEETSAQRRSGPKEEMPLSKETKKAG